MLKRLGTYNVYAKRMLKRLTSILNECLNVSIGCSVSSWHVGPIETFRLYLLQGISISCQFYNKRLRFINHPALGFELETTQK